MFYIVFRSIEKSPRTMQAHIWLLLLCVGGSAALLAYNCGRQDAEISAVNLEEVQECPQPASYSKPEEKDIQVIQTRLYQTVAVTTCLIEVDKSIHYCGMESHVSEVWNGRKRTVKFLNRAMCEQVHSDGIFKMYGSTIAGLQANSSKTAWVQITGTVDTDGTCTTGTHIEGGQTYKNVIVTAMVTVTLRDFWAKVSVKENLIYLPSGRTCRFDSQYCADLADGDALWHTLPEAMCKENEYDILFEGRTNFTVIPELNVTYATVAANEHLFALRLGAPTRLCNQDAFMTEHSRLMIIMKGRAGYAFKRTTGMMMSSNADLATYINTKAMFQEVTTKQRIEFLQKQEIYERCKIERETLLNRLALARTSPDPVARLLQDHMGYNGVVMGSTLFLVRCVPQSVELRNASRCYQEVPITVDGRDAFMSASSRIIIPRGQEVTCNPIVAPTHFIDGTWYKFNPNPVILDRSPEMLKPTVSKGVAFPLFKEVATGGLYATSTIQDLQENLEFAAERNALLNSISRRALGRDTDQNAFIPARVVNVN